MKRTKTQGLSLLACIALLGMASCKEKPQSTDIIMSKDDLLQTTEVSTEVQEIGNYDQTVETDWVGSTYTVEMHRVADESLPIVDDGSGRRYYDNKITIRILRKDGSEFFSRTFTKADFNSYLDASFKKNGALLGIVFDRVEGDNLYFAASVGSPDRASDEFIPLVVKVSKLRQVSISKDTMLDTGSVDNPSGANSSEDTMLRGEENEEEDGV